MIEKLTEGLFADRPSHITGGLDDYSVDDLRWIASRFKIDHNVTVEPFAGRGNINLHTYLVHSGGKQYLLQKVNSSVFSMPHRVMSSMIATLDAAKTALQISDFGEEWEPIELVSTIEGQPYLDLTDGDGWSVWRTMVRIEDAQSFKSLSELPDREYQLQTASEAGRGLAIFSDLTSGIDVTTVEGSLPGYRDTVLYFNQFRSILAGNRSLQEAHDLLPTDPIVRSSTEAHFVVELSDAEFRRRLQDEELQPFIRLALNREFVAMRLWAAIESEEIRRTVIHGDTKLENFLFSETTGRVKSLVDLDTVMAFNWLADYGDMQRSLVNVAGEKERDLSKVAVDEGIYQSVAQGFLNSSTGATPSELALMDDAVKAITLELGVRFLTDYLRGDTYFRLAPEDPPDLNKVRAMVQLTLFERLCDR